MQFILILKKTFDKVPHKRLLNKIRSYGFPRELTNWIEAFLLGRKYRVRVNGKKFRIGIQSSVAYHREAYWNHFYLYCILMIWQTWIQVITGQTYICVRYPKPPNSTISIIIITNIIVTLASISYGQVNFTIFITPKH